MAHGRRLICAWAMLGMFSVGCADNNVYVMFERYEIDGDERTYAGGGCMIAISHGLGGGTVSSGGGSVDGDLAVSEHGGGDAFVVVVSSQGEELERREYDEKTLLTGERDQFTVTTQAGRQYELTYWGGHECDTSHLQAE
jgi:hypothetical protein